MRPLLALVLTCVLSACSFPPDGVSDKTDIIPEAESGLSALKSAKAEHFMAVTANPHASNAAYQMLARGGSAVDAAIAAQLVLGLAEPQSSGIGGGAFVLHWDNTARELSSWDGRETAPAALEPDHFLQDGAPLSFFEAVIGGHSVGIPGVVALLETLHQNHGQLPWRTLFEPAIQLAREGFAISPRLHTLLEKMPRVAVNPAIRDYFFQSDGKTPKAIGTRLKNPAYADTLALLAEQGANAFYRGELAQKIVEAVANDPNRVGKLRLQDLANYRALKREPVCADFRRYRVCGMAPPSSGGTTVAAILGTLQHVANAETARVDQIHRFAEASRLAFADRNHYVGDPQFVDVPTAGLVAADYLKQRSSLIQSDRRMDKAPYGKPANARERISALSPELPSTTHLSIVDSNGNVISMTSSIETAFGSRVMVGGFLLNNQLTDFSFAPKNAEGLVANRAQGGKRPRSSMSPTIVFEGDQPRLAIGSPGGSRIIDYTARTIWDVLENGMPVAQALAAGHVVEMGRGLELEDGHADPSLVQGLEQLGHSVKVRYQTSGLHGIWIGDRYLEGGADPRREGTITGK